MYARFGLAIYLCQTLELQLVNHLTAVRLGSGIDLDQVDELLRGWFGDTMGRHVREVSRELAVSEETAALLSSALRQRNWLVHHYFRSRADQLGSASGIRIMADEIQGYCTELLAADAALTAETTVLMTERGLAPTTIAATSEPFVAAVRAGQTPAGFPEWRALFDHREPPPTNS